MELKNVTLDTNDMSFEDVDALVQQLRAVRARKGKLRARLQNLQSMICNMKEEGMVFVSNYTGEVFNPNDWDIYDETTRSIYPNKECE